MARSTEIAVVYGGGLAQGLALVSFPAAATILTAADGYGLSSNQYGSIFLPLFAGSVLASLLAPTLARRRGLKTVLLAGFGCNALSMATFALSATRDTLPARPSDDARQYAFARRTLARSDVRAISPWGSAERWSDAVLVRSFRPRMVCTHCGIVGADAAAIYICTDAPAR